MDLIDMKNVENHNRGWNYILNVIDLFSKKIWLRKLKTKSGKEVASAIKSVFAAMDDPPQSVIFDEGLEFYNKYVDMLFLQYNIHYYSIRTIKKASTAERAIKTVKSIIFQYFTEHHTEKWIDILENIQNDYNNSYHNSIKMTPNEVTWENRKEVFNRLFPKFDSRIKWTFNGVTMFFDKFTFVN